MQISGPPDKALDIPKSTALPMGAPPPGVDGLNGQFAEAATAGLPKSEPEADDLSTKMLTLLRAAEASSELYMRHVQKSWDRAYRAFQNQHFEGSKYTSKEFATRSKIFRPKTRSAVRKAMASTMTSLFSTVDAIAIGAGNDSDPTSRANAALMQEILNYRTSRTSGRNAIPWFKTAMGASMNATMTGIIVSKQYWKLETKQVGEEPHTIPHPDTGEPADVFEVDEQGNESQVMKPVLKTVFDRPDMIVCAPENVTIDAGADWTDPAQSAAFLTLKWPMKVDEVRTRENDPRDPWHHLEESVLTASNTGNAAHQRSVRTARDGGIDRFDEAANASAFATVWVHENFVRYKGEDYTFFSVGTAHLLTDPRPVDEVYPWNDGERPVIIGYGALEAHRIFPTSPAESWQPMQTEINDLANLTLDSVKMNIAPITKVKRGRQVDLDALKKRGPGTNLLMTDVGDVEFEKPAGVDAGAWQGIERLNSDFDDLAGQFNSGSVMTNRNLNQTVGGMKLLAGSTNALQEFDQRVFIESWAEPALAQVVKLCQYYEHDATILELCGDRAELWQKHGVSQITDELLDKQINLTIDVGLGTGDPQQRLQKFQMATSIAMPIIAHTPEFQSGEMSVDLDAVMQEVYGGAGYRDGGKRFLKKNPPKGPQGPDPLQQSVIAKNTAQAKSAMMVGLSALAKAALGDRQHEADTANNQLDQVMRAQDMGHQHGMAIAGAQQQQAQDAAAAAAGAQPGQPQGGAQPQSPASPVGDGTPDLLQQIHQLLQKPRTRDVVFHRHPVTNRIVGGSVTDS